MNEDFDKDKVMGRVRKMMALANDAGASEGERDNALRMAHATLAKYNLSMAEAERAGQKTDEPRVGDPLESKSTHPWERSVAQSVAKLLFCHYFFNLRTGQGTKHYFVGKQSNAYTAQEMFKYLVSSINKEAQRVSKEATGSGGGTYWRSFCKGAAGMVYQRCEQLVRDSQTQKLEHKTGTALVLASVYAQELEANRRHIAVVMGVNLRSSSDRQRRPELGAYERGAAFGRSLNLNKPTGGGSNGSNGGGTKLIK